MKNRRLGLLIRITVVAGSAALVAFMLGYIAHYDIGLTRLEIRHSALIATAFVAVLIAT
jgi:hypothetical protein